MVKIPTEAHQRLKAEQEAMRRDRLPWWRHWRELADFYLPRRYVWLLSGTERRQQQNRNPHILDGTGTIAARTLASGMMNGITSPSRPWFKLRVPGVEDEAGTEARIWMDEVERRMLLVMAATNFYNSLAVLYLDLVIFGTGAMLMYEDDTDVVRFYNPALGEYYLAQDSTLQVNTFSREFHYKVHQVVDRWGLENVPDQVRKDFEEKGASLQRDVHIVHVVRPNHEKHVASRFKFVEYYWCPEADLGDMLEVRGFNEMPGVFPRWELTANDAYGSSPAMDALGDVIQLQHETKKKGQALDKMVSPPVVADVQLQHKPLALLPNGVTFVQGANNIGVKPIYNVAPPLGELTLDIRDVQARIREIFHNDLFQMISQLDTVRSATEIDARREEKLVLLGPVLERFENEALDPAINRLFGIMRRSGLIPEPPEELQGQDIEVQYVSVLTSAQRAVGVVPLERWLQLVGNVASLDPSAINVPHWEELIRMYGTEIGVPGRAMRSREDYAQRVQAQQELVQARESAAVGADLVGSAKQLSETEVGGGQNALARILGN